MSGDIHIRIEPSGPVIDQLPIPVRKPLMNEGFKRLLLLAAAAAAGLFVYYGYPDKDNSSRRPPRHNERYEERYEEPRERQSRRPERQMIAPDGKPYIGWRECPNGKCGELHTTPAPFDGRKWSWR